jgi:NADH-quinone oxidoreductase subunit M
MSAYYALRLYIGTMHNRKPDGVASREISLRDGVILAPLVLCILGLALYPQLILHRADPSVQKSVAAVTGEQSAEEEAVAAAARGEMDRTERQVIR